MINSNTDFKIFLLNALDYFLFGFGLVRKGTCDKRIDGVYQLVENCEINGYTKEEASKMLNLSTRQFDRRVKRGYLPQGQKHKNDKRLYWDKNFIDKMSIKKKS